jgi:hypothetical protein
VGVVGQPRDRLLRRIAFDRGLPRCGVEEDGRLLDQDGVRGRLQGGPVAVEIAQPERDVAEGDAEARGEVRDPVEGRIPFLIVVGPPCRVTRRRGRAAVLRHVGGIVAARLDDRRQPVADRLVDESPDLVSDLATVTVAAAARGRGVGDETRLQEVPLPVAVRPLLVVGEQHAIAGRPVDLQHLAVGVAAIRRDVVGLALPRAPVRELGPPQRVAGDVLDVLARVAVAIDDQSPAARQVEERMVRPGVERLDRVVDLA